MPNASCGLKRSWLTVYLDQQHHDALRLLSQQQGRSLSAVARELLVDSLGLGDALQEHRPGLAQRQEHEAINRILARMQAY